ncbi:MAG TPA: DinB family protein [Terracidiphilus sp.]|jgi:uncharacterized damage-inducible protein DinB
MELKTYLLAQLDREAAQTRKTIERVPEGQNDFKPHERSMAFGYLATLVATMPGWIAMMIDRDDLNLDEASSEGFRPKVAATKAELLTAHDTAVANAKRALEGTSDEHLQTPWAFKMNGHAISENPRYLMIADSVFSHLAHHRGQLTVYLRLNEAKVPALYGPSADERF